ncbi:beta-glucosidase BglX [Pseudomonas sp. PSKL.D1]|uniref:beta-glucosidase BglX n=1 Tax=Pseudomonas sp. PSKL.D1 TaxID=3029060 RepID=UPI00238188ED|nr:beta-glucosidase BglX [Pseudomonas sp. PSKL.D1]WDY59261.1 beta-glucosidase BglX [Pseudomonas sp. PSKL.D1]
MAGQHLKHIHMPSVLALLMGALLVAGATHYTKNLPANDKERYLDEVLSRMQLSEKVGQLRMLDARGALDSPAIQDLLDAVHRGEVGSILPAPGVDRATLRALQDEAMDSRLQIPLFFAGDVIHGHRTVFPIGLGLASSWDMQAIATSARTAAVEATADGLDMTFAPMVDISRDPRWGRVAEGFGEDPYLAGQAGATAVLGFQGPTVGAADSLMACVKHYAAYGAVEGGRDYNSTDMSPHKLLQYYLPPYRAALDAGAGAVMSAYTTLNGVPASANPWLLHEVLREQWQYRGLVISDYDSVQELIPHGYSATPAEAASAALQAGTQVSMSDRFFADALAGLVEQGVVPMRVLDDAVRQVLATKYDLGLFKAPYRRLGEAKDDPADPNAEQRLHRNEARDVARRSLVLLKNRDQLLPLPKRGTVAVIGPLADNRVDILGSWPANGQPAQAVSLYQGLKTALGNQGKVLYALGANISDDQAAFSLLADNKVDFDPRSPATLRAEALAVARQADVIIAALGEARGMAHEGASKTDLNLPSQQKALLKALKETGKPLVLVLMNGRPMTIEEESRQADAVLEAWFSGTEGGNAIADVLLGDYNPSGKLPVTFPRSVGQIPLYYNRLNTGRPFDPALHKAYRSRYFDIDDTPLYPFGFGLSYTQFSLSPPSLSTLRLQPGHTLQVEAQVQNTGGRAGETVVQLYIRDISGSVSRPIKELKGFQKVLLAPGEKRQITFDIEESTLSFYNQNLQWGAEPGAFDVMVGLDSEQVSTARFELMP